ncbi:suppressor protein SRP40-like, partial [Stegastes partitus]|uniref:Suppressor protein SRP40-like n=1 Tax=Stegastes partitus TaxID=144197 RepID=A0A9Y4NU70_9TELE
MNIFRRDKSPAAPTPVVPPRPSQEELDNPITHSLNRQDAGTTAAPQRTGVMGVMQKVNPFKSASQASSSVNKAASSESLEQTAESSQNPGVFKGVIQKVNPFKSTSQVSKAPSAESLEQGRASDSTQNPGVFKGVIQKVNPFKSSSQAPKSDPQNDSANPQEAGKEPQDKQNPGKFTGMMQKVNPFKSSQPKDAQPLHNDLSSSSGSLTDGNNVPEKQNPGIFRGMMNKVNPFKSYTQMADDECQTDSAAKAQESQSVHSENSTSSESLDDTTIERHSIWYTDADTSCEVRAQPAAAPKRRRTFIIKRILPGRLFGSGAKDSSATEEPPQEIVEVQTLELADVPVPGEGTVQDPLDVCFFYLLQYLYGGIIVARLFVDVYGEKVFPEKKHILCL